MAPLKCLVKTHSREIFGERLDALDRQRLARTIARVDSIPVDDLREFARVVVEVLWGVGFCTHSRRGRGIGPKAARVCPDRLAELAWGVYYGSWVALPTARPQGAGGGR